jgi:hypothetical protein
MSAMKTDRLRPHGMGTHAAVKLLIAFTMALCLTSATPGGADRSLSGSQAGDQVSGATIRLEAVGTQREGATGRPRTAWVQPLQVGQTARLVLVAGSASDADVCNAAFAQAGEDVSGYLSWQFEITLLAASADSNRLQVRWTRTGNSAAGPKVRKEETEDIRLRPDEQRVLDYVENGSTTTSPCASLLVRLTALRTVQASNLRSATVDMWLVEEEEGRPVRSIYERLQGAVGEDLPFQMFSLDYPVSDRVDDPMVKLGVSGTLRLVPAPDNRVDIDISAWRKFAYGERWARGEGRTKLRATVGETVALILPDPRGSLNGERVAGHPLDGVVDRGDVLTIDLPRLLAGRHIALYLRVTSVQ